MIFKAFKFKSNPAKAKEAFAPWKQPYNEIACHEDIFSVFDFCWGDIRHRKNGQALIRTR
jgi:hypothetical protein